MPDKNIKIQIDSREQKYEHVVQYFKNNNIPYFVSKCWCGDYQLLSSGLVAIDRKQDIIELAGNICGKQHERFRNELIRAKEQGIRLIVLVEEMHNYTSLCRWVSPKYKNGKPITLVKGETLAKAMATMQTKYGVIFKFCHRADVGKTIVQFLVEENKKIKGELK